jgi:glycolate oxidase iron-sulfur subunit
MAGCIANVCFARLNEATVRVLQKNGCEVVVPEGRAAAERCTYTPACAEEARGSRGAISTRWRTAATMRS